MKYIRFSVIIPYKDSLDTLSRLLGTIPDKEDIETIVIDNSEKRISRKEVNTNRKFQLLYSEPCRFAGGARNVGLDVARGEWLIFADADDFFTPSAFDSFSSFSDSDKDLIYFKVNSVYDDTLEPSNRGELWCSYIDKFKSGEEDELGTKISYLVPWGKMVRRSIVEDNNIRFEEVVAANDVMFSTKVGLAAKRFAVSDDIVYTVTTRKGSLANRRDYAVTKSRYMVNIRRNLLLREFGYRNRQSSIMVYLYRASKLGLKPFVEFLWLAIKYRQNFFIGYKNWIRTFKFINKDEREKKNYLQ